MSRVAKCHCGQVQITCEGEPHPVIMCTCQLCQRRTGGPIHIGAWFPLEKVKLEGETKAFTRTTGDQGREVTFNFCPQCGTSIWWGGSSEGPFAGRIGIAGGCFAESECPAPTFSAYDKRRPAWLAPPAGITCYADLPPPGDMMKLLSD